MRSCVLLGNQNISTYLTEHRTRAGKREGIVCQEVHPQPHVFLRWKHVRMRGRLRLVVTDHSSCRDVQQQTAQRGRLVPPNRGENEGMVLVRTLGSGRKGRPSMLQTVAISQSEYPCSSLVQRQNNKVKATGIFAVHTVEPQRRSRATLDDPHRQEIRTAWS